MAIFNSKLLNYQRVTFTDLSRFYPFLANFLGTKTWVNYTYIQEAVFHKLSKGSLVPTSIFKPSLKDGNDGNIMNIMDHSGINMMILENLYPLDMVVDLFFRSLGAISAANTGKIVRL